MVKTVTAAVTVVALPLILMILVAAGPPPAAQADAGLAGAPTTLAKRDIPLGYLLWYMDAAQTCPGLPWAVLAGIGKVESDHGRSNAPGVHSGANGAGAEVISGWCGPLGTCGAGGDTPRSWEISAGCEACALRSDAMGYRAERAVSPSDGAVAWVVVDDDYELHDEGCAFLAGLRGRDRSVNTERLYAGRVALFLSWCAGEAVEWRQVRLDQMVRFKRWLAAGAPAPARGPGPGAARRRSLATADAILGTVCEFFRFCARHELVAPALAAMLYEPRFLRFLPPGYEAGEDGQFRTVRSRVLRFAVAEKPFEFLEPDRVGELVAAACNARDRFLVALVAMTGMRIGEVLGLRREDMHLLADSRSLGCAVAGPHVHVRRRADNPNGALAKSRFPRTIPVPAEVATLYAGYAHERYARLGADEDNAVVFVNLYRPPLGGALKYQNVKEMFDRLARATGLTVRPHLLRHTAATTWLRQGTPRDAVQDLLGHVSPSSMRPYLHPDEAGKRAAVERGAAWVRRQP